MLSEFRLVGLYFSQKPSTSKVGPIDHREDDRSCAWPFYRGFKLRIRPPYPQRVVKGTKGAPLYRITGIFCGWKFLQFWPQNIAF